MNISKLTVTAVDAIPQQIKNAVKFTRINPDIDIATLLIKEKLNLQNDVVEISKNFSTQNSKKNNIDVFDYVPNNETAKMNFYKAKCAIENSIAYMTK